MSENIENDTQLGSLLIQTINRLHQARLVTIQEKNNLAAQLSGYANAAEIANNLLALNKTQVLTFENKQYDFIDLQTVIHSLVNTEYSALLVEALSTFTSLHKEYQPHKTHIKKIYAMMLAHPNNATTIVKLWEIVQNIKTTGAFPKHILPNCALKVKASLFAQLEQHGRALFLEHPEADDNCVTFLSYSNHEIIALLSVLNGLGLLNQGTRAYLEQQIQTRHLNPLNKLLSTHPALFDTQNALQRLQLLQKANFSCTDAKELITFYESKKIPEAYKTIYEPCVIPTKGSKSTTHFLETLHENLCNKLTREAAHVICLKLQEVAFLPYNLHQYIFNLFLEPFQTEIRKIACLKYLMSSKTPAGALTKIRSIQNKKIEPDQLFIILLNALDTPEMSVASSFLDANLDIKQILVEYYNRCVLISLQIDEFKQIQQASPNYVLPNQKTLQLTSYQEAIHIVFSTEDLLLFNQAMNRSLAYDHYNLQVLLSRSYEPVMCLQVLQWLIKQDLFEENTARQVYSLTNVTNSSVSNWAISDFKEALDFLTTKSFFDSQEKRSRFSTLATNTLNAYTVSERNRLMLCFTKTVPPLYDHSSLPKQELEALCLSLSAASNWPLLLLLRYFNPLLKLEFNTYYDYLIKHNTNTAKHTHFILCQGIFLSSLLHSAQYTPEKRDMILLNSAENLSWLPIFITALYPFINLMLRGESNFNPNELYRDINRQNEYFSPLMIDTFLGKQYTPHEKSQLIRFIRLSSVHVISRLQDILQHKDILLSDQIIQTIEENIAAHLCSQDFINSLIQISADPLRSNQEKIQLCLTEIENNLNRNRQPRVSQQINYEQSVHGLPMEQSASNSAENLKKRYGSTKKNIVTVGQEILEYIATLQKTFSSNQENNNAKTCEISSLTPIDNFKATAAAKCVQRIVARQLNYKIKNITIQALLIYLWEAAHEKNKDLLQDKITLKDAKDALINGLYEVQRSYNLEHDDIDDNGEDRISCTKGSFFILAGSLRTIHKDVEIRFITSQQASNKFTVIVKDEITLHLKQQQSCLEEHVFTQLVESIAKGNEYIWDTIKNNVIVKLIEEYGELYDNDINNKAFVALINTYIDIDITPTLTPYQNLKRTHGLSMEDEEIENLESDHPSKRSKNSYLTDTSITSSSSNPIFSSSSSSSSSLNTFGIFSHQSSHDIPPSNRNSERNEIKK